MASYCHSDERSELRCAFYRISDFRNLHFIGILRPPTPPSADILPTSHWVVTQRHPPQSCFWGGWFVETSFIL